MYGGPSYTLDETIDMLVKQFGPPTFSGSTDEEDVVNKRNLSRLELEKWLARQTTIWWGESGFNKSDGSCKLPCKGVRLRAKIVTWLTPYSPGKESVVSIGLSLTDGSAEEIEDNWVDRRKAATKKTDGLRF